MLARAEPAEIVSHAENASLAEPAEGARAVPTENASLAESSSAEPNENASLAESSPAENAETHAEAAEEEWEAVRG